MRSYLLLLVFTLIALQGFCHAESKTGDNLQQDANDAVEQFEIIVGDAIAIANNEISTTEIIYKQLTNEHIVSTKGIAELSIKKTQAYIQLLKNRVQDPEQIAECLVNEGDLISIPNALLSEAVSCVNRRLRVGLVHIADARIEIEGYTKLVDDAKNSVKLCGEDNACLKTIVEYTETGILLVPSLTENVTKRLKKDLLEVDLTICSNNILFEIEGETSRIGKEISACIKDKTGNN